MAPSCPSANCLPPPVSSRFPRPFPSHVPCCLLFLLCSLIGIHLAAAAKKCTLWFCLTGFPGIWSGHVGILPLTDPYPLPVLPCCRSICPLCLYQTHSPCLFLPAQFPSTTPLSPSSSAWGTVTWSPALQLNTPSLLPWQGTVFSVLPYAASLLGFLSWSSDTLSWEGFNFFCGCCWRRFFFSKILKLHFCIYVQGWILLPARFCSLRVNLLILT